jgi:hypothetical protein
MGAQIEAGARAGCAAYDGPAGHAEPQGPGRPTLLDRLKAALAA